MNTLIKAIEATGSIDETGQLRLDAPLPIHGPSRVRVILLPPEDIEYDDSEISEAEWLRWVSASLADYLNDPEEDIYTLEDGKPLDDEG